MHDLIAIGVETLRIDSMSYLEREFTELFHIYLSIVLYINVNQVDSCHICICGPLTQDTKDIL